MHSPKHDRVAYQRPTGECPSCGYIMDAGRCPECGSEVTDASLVQTSKASAILQWERAQVICKFVGLWRIVYLSLLCLLRSSQVPMQPSPARRPILLLAVLVVLGGLLSMMWRLDEIMPITRLLRVGTLRPTFWVFLASLCIVVATWKWLGTNAVYWGFWRVCIYSTTWFTLFHASWAGANTIRGVHIEGNTIIAASQGPPWLGPSWDHSAYVSIMFRILLVGYPLILLVGPLSLMLRLRYACGKQGSV